MNLKKYKNYYMILLYYNFIIFDSFNLVDFRYSMPADRSYIIAAKRASEFPDDLYAEKQKLCLFCDISLALKLSTSKEHLKCPRHLEKKHKKANQPNQLKLAESLTSSQLRSEFVKDFVKMCLVANIPLEKNVAGALQ